MRNNVEKFYERKYKRKVKIKPRGLLALIFTKLRRLELTRIQATYKLLEQGEKILDLGMGEGDLLAMCKQNKMFKQFYGIELSPTILKKAHKNIKRKTGDLTNVVLKYADLNSRLSFKPKSFDTITMIAVMEHIFDPYFAMAEIKRLIKKNGIFVIEVPNIAWFPRRFALLFGKLPETAQEEGWDGGHLHYFTFEATKELIEKYGFEVVYMGSSGIFSRVRNIWPQFLGGNIIVKARKK
jgi:ubiquinone/menaquinone biosynthesis C-methylase UbiE